MGSNIVNKFFLKACELSSLGYVWDDCFYKVNMETPD